MQEITKNKIIKKICDYHEIKLIHCRSKKFGGCADGGNRIIRISRVGNKTKRQYISTFFHELGHIYCHDNDIFPVYHNKKFDKYGWQNLEKLKKAYKLTAWKAEKFVDSWAEKEMKKYYPKMKFIPGYGNESYCKKYLYNFLDEVFSPFL